MHQDDELLPRLEAEIERRLTERFAALRDEFDRLRLESDRRWAGFVERFEQDFSGIVPGEMLVRREEPAGPPSGAVGIEDARTIDAAASQVEALQRFLELARRRASRVALLVAKGGSLGVWKAVGFSDHGLDDEAVRRVAFAADETQPLARALEGSPQRLSRGNEISRRFEASDATDAVIVPMVVKEKVSGAVYADATPGEEGRFDPDGIALLTYFAGLVVDRLATRKLRPAPPLKPIPAPREKPVDEDISDLGIPRPREVPLFTPPLPPPPAAARDFAPPAPARELEPPAPAREFGTPALEPEPPPPPPAPAPPEPEPPSGLSAEPAGWEDVPEVPAPPPPMRPPESPAATVRMPEVSAPLAPPPAPAWRPDAPAASVAPPAERKLAGPLARAEGDERKEEARRFAKLLVSEIKLYNERAVQEGREQGNLYERLKDDIDRSRQMYEERIPDDVRSSTNFFYEELVRTLADGRADALGM